MDHRHIVESARIEHEHRIAAANNLAQYAPARRSVSQRIADRITSRRARHTAPPSDV